MASSPLTAAIAGLEQHLDGLERDQIEAVTQASGIDRDLLAAAITVRRDLGRISDLIHAAAIVLVLPYVMEEGEQISNRPSLAAGNDPTRPYDLETNRRVAEFKLSQWAAQTPCESVKRSRTW